MNFFNRGGDGPSPQILSLQIGRGNEPFPPRSSTCDLRRRNIMGHLSKHYKSQNLSQILSHKCSGTVGNWAVLVAECVVHYVKKLRSLRWLLLNLLTVYLASNPVLTNSWPFVCFGEVWRGGRDGTRAGGDEGPLAH